MVDYNQILNEIVARDSKDSTRAVGPLVVAPGAKVIDTTSITQEQVVETIVACVKGSAAE